MKRIIFLLLVAQIARAQKTIEVGAAPTNGFNASNYYTAGGVPLSNVKFVNLKEGSPYFADEWMKGLMVGKTGQRFASRLLKLDLLNKEVHFINTDGSELISTVAARQIILTDTINNRQYYFFHASCFTLPPKETNEWFEVLDTGKISLYKVYRKLVTETLPHNASTYEQRITTVPEYFIERGDTLIRVKKLKDIGDLFPVEKKEIEAYIKEKNEKNLSMDEQWKALISHYNSIASKN